MTPPDGPLGRGPAPETRRRRVWGSVWRMLVATAVGAVAFGSFLADDPRMTNGLAGLDFLLGIIAIGLLPLRRSAPLPVVLAIAVCAGFSTFGVGAFAIAVISLATRRRWQEIVAVGLAALTAGFTHERLLGPSKDWSPWWALVLVGVLFYGSLVVTGLYVGGRRELLVTLRDRAETAEREAAARLDQARATERTRIAREMHDVLAHRISLVAMYAGALTFRDDLSREQAVASAEVIRVNAHLALTELRTVLGVLRDTNDDATGPDLPQPTLDTLPELLAECTAAGNQVTYLAAPNVTNRLGELPEQASRNAFRILQESLTNARKHAPGQAVLVEIGGSPGNRLTLSIGNDRPEVAPAHAGSMAAAHGSGLGLIGLVERARLAGGELSHGVDQSDRFVVRAWVPWPM